MSILRLNFWLPLFGQKDDGWNSTMVYFASLLLLYLLLSLGVRKRNVKQMDDSEKLNISDKEKNMKGRKTPKLVCSLLVGFVGLSCLASSTQAGSFLITPTAPAKAAG